MSETAFVRDGRVHVAVIPMLFVGDGQDTDCRVWCDHQMHVRVVSPVRGRINQAPIDALRIAALWWTWDSACQCDRSALRALPPVRTAGES